MASSSSHDRIRVSLETTDLIRFFEPNLFSAGDVRQRQAGARSVPARGRTGCGCDPADCIVVEDSPVGVTAGVAAGMTVIGFVGGSHAGGNLGDRICGPPAPAPSFPTCARSKSTIIDLRGW